MKNAVNTRLDANDFRMKGFDEELKKITKSIFG